MIPVGFSWQELVLWKVPLPDHPSVGDALSVFKYSGVFGLFFFPLDGLKIPMRIPIDATSTMETPWKFHFPWVKPSPPPKKKTQKNQTARERGALSG